MKRVGLTVIEVLVAVVLIAIVLALLVPAVEEVRKAAVAVEMMRDTAPPTTPAALQVVEELAKSVTVDERDHDGHYHAFLRIPVKRYEEKGTEKEVTGGILIAALEKGVHAWASSQGKVVLSFSWYKETYRLVSKFRVQKK